MRWEKLFEPHILERGYVYYREGSVTDISINEDQIDATVEGSEDYSVTIDLKMGRFRIWNAPVLMRKTGIIANIWRRFCMPMKMKERECKTRS